MEGFPKPSRLEPAAVHGAVDVFAAAPDAEHQDIAAGVQPGWGKNQGKIMGKIIDVYQLHGKILQKHKVLIVVIIGIDDY